MEYKDYYKILDISRNASQDEIKRAYRKKARKYHPDVSHEKNAEQQFKEIGEAYEVLKDTEKRAAYDQLGTRWRSGEEFRPPPGWNFDFEQGGFRETSVDFSDFFENLFGGTVRQKRHHRVRTAGEDQQTKIAITLEEAYQGTTRAIHLQVPKMNANGQRVNQTRTLNIKIPTGIIEGQKIRLGGQGGTSMSGGTNGDLYLEIEFQSHRLYHAEGRDIYLTLPITPWEAALGSTIAVPTLGGNVDMKIPAGSQSGQKLRLKERGFPGQPPGDHYIELKIVTPNANTETERSFYHQMAQEFSFNPRAEMM
ncbi:curved DNA-binding protein [Beggiatoa sp. PS]|nr:curved DNA-binding protein [Beggiatoa sp. PS]